MKLQSLNSQYVWKEGLCEIRVSFLDNRQCTVQGTTTTTFPVSRIPTHLEVEKLVNNLKADWCKSQNKSPKDFFCQIDSCSFKGDA